MPLDADGNWYPNLFPKQLEVFNSRDRALLVSGPRLSGKTRAVLHRIVRHMWETDGARVAMFSKTIKTSKDGGSWSLMTKSIVKEWINAKIGFKYTSENKGVFGPKTDGVTRTLFFRTTNAHKTESELLLFSLDNDQDAEVKLKEMEFSMIYFSELDKFGDGKVLTVALPSLRMGHLKFEDQMWIADCNPSEDGDQSWIYQRFYLERNMDYEAYTAHQKRQELPVLDKEDFTAFFKQLNVIEILPRDNPFVDPRQLQEVRVSCGSDQGLYARHVDGKWVWGGGDSSRHFRALFKKNIHVIGNVDSPREEDWITIVPTSQCFELVTGWDVGDMNHAAVIMETVIRGNSPCFHILDELESVGTAVSLETFTEGIMEQIESLEKTANREMRLDRAWSDRSSIEKYSATADTYPHLVVNAASRGRVFLRGVPKAAGSVRVRVQLLKTLLAQKRIFVSANCKAVIKMLTDLKKGTTPITFVLPEDPLKHIFDALTYALLMECAEELQNAADVPRNVRHSLSVHIE